ncbi:hypothetical protein CRENBAI_003338 [Crenichthys baileyi]|uniref:Uncharacterized protein n=1 Tax=Crenichthys baileyi TaxID=28760 RepID=A0AAV9RKK1_9TELE
MSHLSPSNPFLIFCIILSYTLYLHIHFPSIHKSPLRLLLDHLPGRSSLSILLPAFFYESYQSGLSGVTGRCSRTAVPHQEQSPEELQKLLKPWRRRCCQQDPVLDKSSMVLVFTLLAVSKPASWRTRCGSAFIPIVNSVNLLQSKDCSGSIRSDCKIAPRFTCPACPPSNAIHHLEEPAATACLPVSLGLHCLLTSPQSQLLPFNIKNHLIDGNRTLLPSRLKHAAYGILTLPKNTISINLFKPFLSLWCAALESPGSEPIMTLWLYLKHI